jgi:hypothetical protein
MNLWGFTPSLFGELERRFVLFLQENEAQLHDKEFPLPQAVGELVKEGRARVKVVPTVETWFGVTYQQDKPQVARTIRELVERGVYPENLWEDGGVCG